MLCGVHAALWGQLRKHPVCGCYRSYSRLWSSSRDRDVRPFLPRASALLSQQTAFSVSPECLRWLRPTSWSGSLPSAASPVPSLARLIRVFFSCAHTSLSVGIIGIYTVRYSDSINVQSQLGLHFLQGTYPLATAPSKSSVYALFESFICLTAEQLG